MTTQPFRKALPVWAEGQLEAKNVTVGLRALVQSGSQAELRITAVSLYRVFVNGEFAGLGPARGPHGYHRVDIIDLSPLLRAGTNVIAVEAVGYNVNSYYLPCQPPFVQAELLVDGAVHAWTEPSGATFPGSVLTGRLQKTQRYSFQRPFTEAYRLSPASDAWRSDASAPFVPGRFIQVEPKRYLARGIPPCRYDKRPALRVAGRGSAARGGQREQYWRDRALTNIGPRLGGYTLEELEVRLTDEAQELVFAPQTIDASGEDARFPVRAAAGSYAIYDFGLATTGFVGLDLAAFGDAVIYLLWDEILSEGDVDYLRLQCSNVIKYELAAGSYRLQSFEPYTMRYLKVVVLGADCELRAVNVTGYRSGSAVTARYASGDARLNAVFAAAVETYLQNSADLYMDCPSRERAGWLCDSYFLARVEHCLTGASAVERNFFENFLLPDSFAHLPEGMLPMCYPADHPDGVFIPNWALWFVLQLEDFARRDPASDLPARLRERVYKLFDYFKAYENEFSLLESLEGWVFIEWSRANALVQDVNYPSNMLYAAALEAAGRLYGDAALLEKSAALHGRVRELSFDGRFFTDNAVRVDGRLRNTGEATEVCQYYAFYFGTASREAYPELWQLLLEQFGPQRKHSHAFPEVAFANTFVGNYLRLELLLRAGLNKQMIGEMRDYFYYMAERTGTLWENDSTVASCDHGFASYAAYLLLNCSRTR